MLKIIGFCMPFLLLLQLLLFSFICFSTEANPSLLLSDDGNTTRHLKENSYGSTSKPKFEEGDSEGDVILEDYRPFDPTPSSKASVRSGPIQHGTPLMPYIPNPKPSPPPSYGSP
ncbi:unnamed protein product [Amaranthus hypochondriacus]